MAFQVSPALRNAIEPSKHADMGVLLKGLRLLNQADPFIEVMFFTREHDLAADGKVHLNYQGCVKDQKVTSLTCKQIKGETGD